MFYRINCQLSLSANQVRGEGRSNSTPHCTRLESPKRIQDKIRSIQLFNSAAAAAERRENNRLCKIPFWKDMKADVLVVCGPCGCGKSEVGIQLAKRLVEGKFLDADDLHPPDNVAKMGTGIPLSDADRIPWLKAVRKEMIKECQEGRRKVVVACSALKKMYRQILAGHENLDEEESGGSDMNCFRPKVKFILIHCSIPILEERLRQRQGHFMKSNMLESQLRTLEFPEKDELSDCVIVDGDLPVDGIVTKVLQQI